MVLNAEQIKNVCCKKKCKDYESISSKKMNYINTSYGSGLSCYFNNIESSDKYDCGFQSYSSNKTLLNIDKCETDNYNKILKKINILTTGNLVNNLDKEDDYTKGLMIGGVISLILCIGLFFMAKFKIINLIYDQCKELINNHFPIFVLGLVFSIIIGTVIFYIFWRVKGYGIKSHEHIGYFELYNTIDSGNKQEKYDQHMPKSYKLGTRKTMNESYLFYLNIKENNKNNTNSESCIFAIQNNSISNGNTKHLLVSLLNHENILRISSDKLKEDILIDNIPFKDDIFVCIIFNKEMIEVYVNAKLVKNKIYNNDTNVDPEDLKIIIGNNTNIEDKDINGTIEGSLDLTMYDIPLTHTQITQHYVSLIKVTQNYVKYMYALFVGLLKLPKKILFGDDSATQSNGGCSL